MESPASVLCCKEPERQIGVQASSPVAWSFDGELFAYASGAYSILLYKHDADKKVFVPFLSLVKHTRSIHALLFHPTLPLLLSAGADGLMVWNTTTGELLQVIDESTCEEAHESAIECLCWGYGGSVLFTASKDATIKIWQTEKNFKYLETIQAHRSAILALTFNEPYNMLISAGRDSSINLWDVVTLSPSKIAIREDDKGTCCSLLASMDGHLGDVSCLCLSSSGSLLFSGARDNSIRSWDLKSRTNIREIRDSNQFQKGVHQGDVRGLYLVNQDQYLLSFGADGDMKLFKLGEMKSENNDRVDDMMVNLDTLLKGFVESEEAKEVVNDDLIASVAIEESGVFAATLNPRYPYLLLSGNSNVIKVYDVSSSLSTPALKQEYVGHHDAVTDIAIMDDKHIVSVSKDYSVNIYNVHHNAREFHFDFSSAVLSIGCLEDLLFVTGVDYNIKAYSINKSRYYQTMEQCYLSTNTKIPAYEYELLHLTGHSGKINSISVCKDLRMIATGSEDIPDSLDVVPMNRAASSIPSITAHTVLNNHHGSVCSVNFSDLIGDYYYLSSVGNDYSLITYRLRDDHSLSPYWTLPNAHNSVITCVEYGHHESKGLIFTGGWDNVINIWSVEDKKLVLTLKHHTARITELDISPDGQYLVSASADKTIVLWRIQGEKCTILAKYQCNEIPLTVDFFQNSVIAGYSNGVIRLWPLPTGENEKLFIRE